MKKQNGFCVHKLTRVVDVGLVYLPRLHCRQQLGAHEVCTGHFPEQK
jgi:hypothetical protein